MTNRRGAIGPGPIGPGPIGPRVPFDVTAEINPGILVYQGQQVSFRITAVFQAAAVVVEGGTITFRQTVLPQHDRYYYCGRTGFRAPLSQLVEDGHRRGLYVDRRWADEPHPQDYPPIFGPDGVRDRSAPPQDPVEVYEQVTLIVDGQEIEV